MPHYLTSEFFSLAALGGCQVACACTRQKLRRRVVIITFFFVIIPRVRAQEASLWQDSLIPKDTQLWTESMLWNEQASFSSGVGYQNNVLLSPSNAQGSGFVINGLDLLVMRLPLDGWKVVVSVVGSDTRFWRNVGTCREDFFVGSLRVERELPDDWHAGLESRGQYEDQVLEISTSQATPATALVEGYGLTAQPYLRKDFSHGLWLKTEVPVTRWYFQAPLDDYWEFGPVATAGYDLSPRTQITLSYADSFELHEQWLALDSYGAPEEQHLDIFQQQVELAWLQYWDEQRRWHSSTRLSFADRRDNGGSYFNYFQYQAAEDLRWETADWAVTAGGQIAYNAYPVQTNEQHGSAKLFQNMMELSVELEYRLLKSLKSFAKLEYQRTFSNEILNQGDFNSTTVSGGLRYEF